MKYLRTHESPGLNSLIQIEVADAPAPGEPIPLDKACYSYQFWVNSHGQWEKGPHVKFQKGPVRVVDERGNLIGTVVNGASVEGLIAVLIDHLQGHQLGKLACQENDAAVRHLREALHWQHARTQDRTQREVEGSVNP